MAGQERSSPMQWRAKSLISRNFDFCSLSTKYPEDRDAWIPHEVLGQGTFGVAGVWKKHAKNGVVVDETVIKQELRYDRTREIWPTVRNETSINRDAQRNADELYDPEDAKGGRHSTLHIRQYRYNQLSETCRYYSISAPHYTVLDLISRYKVKHTYIPELFLWHLFYSLAKAIYALDDVHHSSLLHESAQEYHLWSQHCCILHLDIKPENIFLDYAPIGDEEIDAMYRSTDSIDDSGKDSVRTYPVIRLVDFGLSKYVGPQDRGRNQGGRIVHRDMSLQSNLDLVIGFQREIAHLNRMIHLRQLMTSIVSLGPCMHALRYQKKPSWKVS